MGWLGALCALALLSCPINIPEKVRLKAAPSLYMPLGSPLGDHLGDLTSGLGQLTDLEIGSSGDALVYDYRGPEYGDTRVVMVVMKDLVNESFATVADGLDVLIQGEEQAPGFIPFPHKVDLPVSPGSNDGINLAGLFGTGGSGGVLKDYPGLEFRSIPAYLYIDGPARIFQNGNVSIGLIFIDDTDADVGSPYHDEGVDPVALPGFPAAPAPVETTLSPKPGAFIELKDIFNDPNPPSGLKAQIDFTVGDITIGSLDELRGFAADLRSTPLSAHLVLLLPFQFTAADPIPVFAGPPVDPSDPNPAEAPNPAMELISGGGDLLGRDGGGEGTMEDIMESVKSLSLETNVVNNLGINGYVMMLREMPSAANPKPPEVGQINLSGTSSLTIAKADLDAVPFSPALEIYLNGDFDIKRSLPEEGAMTMTMAVILRTDVDMTF
jgi:hypothetical protein